MILAKDRTIGYLAQHEAVSSGNSIYEELLEVKQDIFELERHIRTLELQMKSQSGGELEQTLELYNRLNTEFEQKNGYACKSEIVGVLKGLGFTEDEFSKQVDTLSGGQKTRVAGNALLLAKPDLICRYLERRMHLHYDPLREVLVTVGNGEAIDMCIRTIVQPGDEVIIPEPCFVCYEPITTLSGGVPVHVCPAARR